MTAQVFVGMPVYNRPALLRDAIESLTRQTCKDFELLISDNASPDPRVREIALQYAERDPRIRYFRQETNLGPAENFRSVLAKCNSPFFMWASDDDVWEPDFIAHNLAQLEQRLDIQMAFGTIDNVNTANRTIRTYPGFSRFSSGPDRTADARRYLLEPEILGKANLVYGLFRTPALTSLIDDLWDRAQFAAWGGDVVLVFAFISRHPIIASDRVLLHKRVPVSSDAPLQIRPPDAYIFPPRHFLSYVARHRCVAPDDTISSLANRLLWERYARQILARITGLLDGRQSKSAS
jgi:glycosyltransferase involved in cell wall biosynthesis